MRTLSIAVAAGAGVLVLGMAILVGWQWRHPSAFEDYGSWGVGTRDWPAGETAYVGLTFPDDSASGTVTVHDADSHGLVDETGATVEYYLCTVGGGAARSAIGIEHESQIARDCHGDLVPADDAAMSLAEQQLVAAITPAREGVLSFHGLDLHYSDGWQNGTQRVGGDVKIRVRDHG